MHASVLAGVVYGWCPGAQLPEILLTPYVTINAERQQIHSQIMEALCSNTLLRRLSL